VKKDVLMVTPFTELPGEEGNGRFRYLAQRIDKSKATVEVVTTDFSHSKKTRRYVCEQALKASDYKVTLLHEPGYTKNISIRRYISHYGLGDNLRRYLTQRKRPDVVYCAVPPTSVAKVAAEYAKEHGIPFVIDVQDIWPDAFRMFFDCPLISDFLFYPVKREADYVYASADHIIAVSETFANRALNANTKCKEATVVYLGTDLQQFDVLAAENAVDTKNKKELWVAYVGTLSHSYDIPTVIDALAILKTQKGINVKFVVMGDGPLRETFELYAQKKDVWVEFTGRLGYGKMVGLLTACDIAVNPIVRGSGGSILNKHADYSAAGLPVLNTQDSMEYRQLVDEWQIGLNCKSGDAHDLAAKMLEFIQSKELREKCSRNSRKLAEEKFDRRLTYSTIINILMLC